MAIDRLTKQHREAEQLLNEAKSAEGSAKISVLGRLAEALTLHTALEEQYFYPLLRRAGLESEADRSTGEHQKVKHLISELLQLKRRDPRLNQVIASLAEAVRQHVGEEEQNIFPRLREKVSPEELSRVGEDIERAMAELSNKELLKMAEHEELPAV